jgi:hypothetical protein
MLDAEMGKSSQGMGGARADDASRKANVQRSIAAVSALEKLVSQFQSLSEAVESSYASFDKKLDGFYQDIFAAVGKFSAIIDNATAYLAEREPVYSDAALAQSKDTSPEFKKCVADIKGAMAQCKTALADGSKMIAVLKDAQVALDKDEDGVRSSVVAFKKNRTDFVANYSKVSSLKNEIFAQATDGKNQADQIDDVVKKTQELYAQASSKDSPGITASMKKIEESMAKLKTDIDALKTLMDKVKGFVTSIGKNEDTIARKDERAAVLPSSEAKKASSAKKTLDPEKRDGDSLVDTMSDDAALGSGGMPYAVLSTIGQGFKILWANLVKVFVTIRGERILANTGDVVEDPLLTEKKSELKSAAWNFGSGAWKLFVSGFDYVKHVFVQLSARPALAASSSADANAAAASLKKDEKDSVSGVTQAPVDVAAVAEASLASSPALPPMPGLVAKPDPSMPLTPNISSALPALPQLAPVPLPAVSKNLAPVPLPLPAAPASAQMPDSNKGLPAVPALPALPGLPPLPALPAAPKI